MAPKPPERDPLLEQVTEIRQHIAKEGLSISYDAGDSEGLAEIFWNEDIGGGWENFFACAAQLKVTHVYFHWRVFEASDLDELAADAQIPAASGSESAETLEMLGEKVGLVGNLTLAFVSNGIMHFIVRTTDWFRAYQELRDDDGEDEDSIRGPANPELISKWALKLAEHSQYSRSSYDQRKYLLEKLAGNDWEFLPAHDILQRAESVYQFELRPKDQENLKNQAMALRKNGLTLNAIAQELGISRDRVSGLLGVSRSSKPE